MEYEPLKTIVLLGEGVINSPLMETLPSLPQVEVWGAATSPDDVLNLPPEFRPELVIVDLDQQQSLPPWLSTLNQSLPQSTVMVCSQNRDPDFLIKVIHSGVREFLPLPLTQADLEAALERVRLNRKQHPHHEAAKGQMVIITGLKGGMGVTSIAVNLAVALAEAHPKRVLLVDMGRPFPDIANFLDLKKTTSILDLVEHSQHLEMGLIMKTIQPHAADISVLHGCSNPELLDPKSLGKVWNTLRSLYDWIVVDLSHNKDDVVLKTLNESNHVLLITDLLLPNLENLKRWWDQYDAWQLDRGKVKVIVNRYRKNEGVDLEDLQSLQRHSVYLTLPNDYVALSECINHGVPLKELAPRSKLTRSIAELSQLLASDSEKNHAGEVQVPKKKRWFWFF